ncbi:DDE-type integrase/transposase/recombinase [Thalassomonas sp. M1454]|uniref:DDE-type integrase/transposase/recombinase n=1 Tax=Thalassomonas sp. M1454 TaxID=2594477 RepID=UPI00117BE25A|nr:DDE-type integrase/transposase/recombinase [Thalassomonas sp. M1454]TRX55164.1 transposase family protein [Thalassomonas sp. M1454]
MGQFALAKGGNIMYREKPATIVVVEPECIVLKVNQGLCTLTPAEFYEESKQGHIKKAEPKLAVIKPVVRLSDEERKLADKYRDYFHGLEFEDVRYSTKGVARVISRVSKERGDTGLDIPKVGTLKKWYRKFTSDEIGRDIIKMVKPQAITRSAKFSEAMFEIFYDTVDECYMKLKGDSVEATYQVYLKRAMDFITTLNLEDPNEEPIISRSTFFEYVNEYDPYEVDAARYGRAYAENKYRNTTEHIVATRPLEFVQIDAVHINLGLTDKEGNYVGMPVVYFAIDIFTRAILSFVISYGEKRSEGALAAVELIKRLIKPQEKPAHTQNGFLLFGKPDCIRHDSGVFKSKLCSDYYEHMSISAITSQVKKAYRNGIVERFHRTFKGHCCMKIAGCEGGQKKDYKDNVDIKVEAVCQVDEFASIVETYILDVYHETDHRGIDRMTPKEMTEKYQSLVELPSAEYIAKADASIGYEISRTIQQGKGIEINGLFYNDRGEKLIKLCAKMTNGFTKPNPKVTAFYNELDISKIAVLNPYTNELFDVPSTSVKEPISLTEHKAVKANGKKRDTKKHTDRPTIETKSMVLLAVNARYESKANQPNDDVPKAEEAEPAREIKAEELDLILEQGKRPSFIKPEPEVKSEPESQGQVSPPSLMTKFKKSIKPIK